jgi:YidC/Oxa1 family membrane protein insertase
MAKPAPKNNFTQTLLIVAMMFLMFQLFMGSKNNQQPDKRTEQDLYNAVWDQNVRRADNSILGPKNDYEKRLQEELDAKKINKAEFDSKKMAAEVLAADAAYRAAIDAQKQGDTKGAFNAATNGYNLLKLVDREYSKSPVWTAPVQVHPDAHDPRTAVTPKELLADLVKLSSALGASSPVWGFFPGYQVVDFLVRATGSQPAFSYAFAALLLAICVRATVWKVAQKQLMWSRQMSQLTPLVNELKEKNTGQELQVKIMALYKEYGMNPAQGCLPLLIQMPFFLLIYYSMVHYRFEFQKGTFLWVGSSLAHKFPGIVAPNLGEKDFALIVIYGISMVVTTLLTPVQDPSQGKQQRMMGVAMSVMFPVMMFMPTWNLPSAFVLYWIFLNVLATTQSIRAYRLPLPPLVKVNAPGGGVYPTNGQPTAERYKNTGTPKVHKPKRAKKK